MKPDTYREHLNDLQVEVEELRAKLKEAQTGDIISRQAALDALYRIDEYNGRSVEAIRNLPSAQPEIIRCKDCKHGTHGTGAEVYCNEHSRTMYQWDYCGRAERINNGQAD